MGDWIFWTAAVALTAGSTAAVLWPLLARRGAVAPRAGHDVEVHRDQLREIEADRGRGLLTDAEAEATRVEVSRRLLAAAAAAERAAAPAAAASPRRGHAAAAAAALALVLAAGGLYGLLGTPGMPDQPLAERQAAARAARPHQAEAEAAAARAGRVPAAAALRPEDADLLAKLQAALATRPDDLEGHRLLARALAGMDRWAEARVAEERVVAILGEKATADDLVSLAEMQVVAAGGYVSPEAEAVLARALTLDPQSQAGRYYSALSLLQGGRPDLAYPIWSRLVAEGPADAPWLPHAKAGLAEAARQLGLPEEGAGAGPTAADIAAAEAMPAGDRAAMIAAMVDGLSARLASAGGPPEDWARLIRSLGVLGRRDEAQAILAEARQTFAADAAGLAAVNAAAEAAGL